MYGEFIMSLNIITKICYTRYRIKDGNKTFYVEFGQTQRAVWIPVQNISNRTKRTRS